MNASATNLASIWWLDPGKLLLFFILPLYLFITLVVPTAWPAYIVLRYGSYLDGPFVALGAACIAMAGGFSLLGSQIEVSSEPPEDAYVVNPRFLTGIGVVTVAAYVVWFGPLAIRGQFFLARDQLNHIPGVTSFGQFGVPFVICYTYGSLKTKQLFPPFIRFLYYAILVLTVVRVFVWGERLALIEIAIPLAIAVLAHEAPRKAWQRAGINLVAWLGPLLALPALLGFFTLTEFFRSWSSASYQSRNLDLGEFMISRLATYYYTALNNGAGLLATTDWPAPGLTHVLHPLYKLPFGIGDAMWNAMELRAPPGGAFLARYADPEFNNMSGIFTMIFDLGVFPGLVYFGVFGFLAGLTFRAMRSGRRFGIMFFPPVYVACAEIMRINYLHGPRSVLILAGAFAAATQMRPRRTAALTAYRTSSDQPV